MSSTESSDTELLTTFRIGQDMFGVGVTEVQEVTGQPHVVPVPLAPPFVRGLINLRGQLATAFGLRELFGVESLQAGDQMTVVCRLHGNLVSLVVDSIGDVLEAQRKDFEPAPETMPANLRKYVKGVYKMNENLLSVIDLEKLSKELSPSNENREPNLQRAK